MKTVAGMLMLALLSPMTMACDEKYKLPVDDIVFQVSAKDWVTTETARLTVDVNATLNNADLVKARADILDKLNTIAKGDWHITQFDRSQDSSGLEKLYVEAEVRVPQSSLTSIYELAKKVSQPGATYSISSVEFKPSFDEVQAVKLRLRQKLYQQVNDELARLNKVYNTQSYTIHNMYIMEGEAPPVQPQAFKKDNTMMMVAAASPAPSIAVSNELIMSAVVEAGSNRIGGSCSGVSN